MSLGVHHLQDVKGRDHDRRANGGACEAMRKGVDRWTLIEDMLWEEGVHNNARLSGRN